MAMQGSFLDFILGWMGIPFRIFLELFKNVFPPKEDAREHNHPSMDGTDGTIDERELKHWTRLSGTNEAQKTTGWWDPEGDFALLRGCNSSRIPIIVETYSKHIAKTATPDSLPLLGARIIDVGCGAGFVSEPLADLGADVTAVDMVPEVIKVAQTHWRETHETGTGPDYICAPIEKISQDRGEEYDIVLCLEVIDHVGNMPEFVAHCCKLLRPGGCAIFTTMNRTLAALVVAVIGAEHLLRVVPMDTHHLYKFVKPSELSREIASHGLRTIKVTGSMPANPFAKRPKWINIPYTGVSYTLVAIKE